MPKVYPEVHTAISYGLSTVSNALNGLSLIISQEMYEVDIISSTLIEENIGV